MAKAKKNNSEPSARHIKSSPSRMQKAIPRAAGRDKLKSVTPSGEKDESFFELVYKVVGQIPRGRATSYGAIAACLGTRLSARMVGWAMNGSHHYHVKIPAHRVVNRNGMLSGKHHFSDPDEMQRLLENEKIKVVNDQIVDFEKVFWDPSTQL